MPRKKDLPYNTEGDIFATRLREVMADRGTNQTRLSAQILKEQGQIMQRQTISQYMNGQSKPDTERLTLLCRALNVSADYLLGINSKETTDVDLKAIYDDIGLYPESIEIIKRLKNIGPSEYYETISNTPDIRMRILNIFIESALYEIILNLEDSYGLYFMAELPNEPCTDLPNEPRTDLIEATKTASKFGSVLLSGYQASQYFGQRASLLFQNFVTHTLQQFEEAEKEAATHE